MSINLEDLAKMAESAKVVDPATLGKRVRGGKPNPFTKLVEAAKADGKARTLPKAFSLKPGPEKEYTKSDGTKAKRQEVSEAQKVENLLRGAAYALGVGMRVDHADKGDQRVITFLVQKKRSERAADAKAAAAAAAAKAPAKG